MKAQSLKKESNDGGKGAEYIRRKGLQNQDVMSGEPTDHQWGMSSENAKMAPQLHEPGGLERLLSLEPLRTTTRGQRFSHLPHIGHLRMIPFALSVSACQNQHHILFSFDNSQRSQAAKNSRCYGIWTRAASMSNSQRATRHKVTCTPHPVKFRPRSR